MHFAPAFADVVLACRGVLQSGELLEMHMKNIRLHAALLAASAALVLAATPCVAQAEELVKIGITAPLSGPPAQSGVSLRQGMTAAAEEWNAKGGVTVAGKPLKIDLLFEDNQANPAQGVSAAQKLITNDQVNFLIGDAFASSVTIAEMDLADQYKIPMMSCEPVSGAISAKIEKDPQKYQYFWKADFNSQGYAATIFQTYAALIKSAEFKPAKKTVAFIVEDTDYGRSIAANATDLFKADGWNVIANNTVPLGNTNFSSALIKLNYDSPGCPGLRLYLGQFGRGAVQAIPGTGPQVLPVRDLLSHPAGLSQRRRQRRRRPDVGAAALRCRPTPRRQSARRKDPGQIQHRRHERPCLWL